MTTQNHNVAPISLSLTAQDAENCCVALQTQAAEIFEQLREAEHYGDDAPPWGDLLTERERDALRSRYQTCRRLADVLIAQLRATEVAQ
jgi:hypothetical protein